jgi:hypothetical protein
MLNRVSEPIQRLRMVPKSSSSNNNNYKIGSRDYMLRARILLDSGRPEAIFHATFELRAGIEARMQEYLDRQSHVPKKYAKEWRVSKLGKNIQKAFFGRADKVCMFAIHDRQSGVLIKTLYYTPVTKKLRAMGEKLGDYLHARRQYRAPSDIWWTETRDFLEEVYRELRVANTGTLIGIPVGSKNLRAFNMRLELPEDAAEAALLREIFSENADYLVEVKYLDKLP